MFIFILIIRKFIIKLRIKMNPRKPAWEKWRGMDMEERKGRAAV